MIDGQDQSSHVEQEKTAFQAGSQGTLEHCYVIVGCPLLRRAQRRHGLLHGGDEEGHLVLVSRFGAQGPGLLQQSVEGSDQARQEEQDQPHQRHVDGQHDPKQFLDSSSLSVQLDCRQIDPHDSISIVRFEWGESHHDGANSRVGSDGQGLRQLWTLEGAQKWPRAQISIRDQWVPLAVRYGDSLRPRGATAELRFAGHGPRSEAGGQGRCLDLPFLDQQLDSTAIAEDGEAREQYQQKQRRREQNGDFSPQTQLEPARRSHGRPLK